MAAIVSGIFDCIGPVCGAEVTPSGLGEVAIGLVFSAIMLAPGVLLHKFLRGRGR